MSCGGLVDVGGGNHILISRIIAVADTEQDSIAGKIEESEESNKLYDLTGSRTTRSAVILDDQSLILTSLTPKTVATRISKQILQEVVLEI